MGHGRHHPCHHEKSSREVRAHGRQSSRHAQHVSAGRECQVRNRPHPLLTRLPVVPHERNHSRPGVPAGTGGPDERLAPPVDQRQRGLDAVKFNDDRPIRKPLPGGPDIRDEPQSCIKNDRQRGARLPPRSGPGGSVGEQTLRPVADVPELHLTDRPRASDTPR